MFIPMEMQRHLRDVRIVDETGATRPLVKAERVLFQAQRPPELTRPPRYLPFYVAVGLVLGGLLALVARAGARGSRGAHVAAVTVIELWSVLSGVIAVLMILAWTLTRHVFTRDNENFLQFEPLSWGLVVLLPLALRTGRCGGAARASAWAVAAVALVGALLKALPAFDQRNAIIIALALPVHLATAWSVALLTRCPLARSAASGRGHARGAGQRGRSRRAA
jgi:hypothetical protein